MHDASRQGSDDIPAMERKYVLQTYKRADFVLVGGRGARVFDSEGRSYLDGVAGIAVNALGHGDPQLVAAIQSAATGLIHVSNLYHSAPQVELARALGARDLVFVSNVPGVLVNGQLADQLTPAQAAALVADGTIRGGMIPKIRSAVEALERGVAAVRITDLAGLERGTGTTVVRARQQT